MSDWIEEHIALSTLIIAILIFIATPWVLPWIIKYNAYVTGIVQ